LVGGNNVCTLTGTVWTCDVSAAGGSSEVYIVSDFSATHDYEAWGNVNGTTFCCSLDDDGLTEIEILGSAYADTLSFSWSAQTYNLTDVYANGMIGTIYGGAGGDQISGADNTTLPEYLYGEDGGDLIRGYQGNDYLDGGNGDDVMLGHAGQDTMYGGAGADEMAGGDGNDTMYGDAGIDRMAGGTRMIQWMGEQEMISCVEMGVQTV
jgi:Ca2+-binding RTX toxin-like protein